MKNVAVWVPVRGTVSVDIDLSEVLGSTYETDTADILESLVEGEHENLVAFVKDVAAFAVEQEIAPQQYLDKKTVEAYVRNLPDIEQLAAMTWFSRPETLDVMGQLESATLEKETLVRLLDAVLRHDAYRLVLHDRLAKFHLSQP